MGQADLQRHLAVHFQEIWKGSLCDENSNNSANDDGDDGDEEDNDDEDDAEDNEDAYEEENYEEECD